MHQPDRLRVDEEVIEEFSVSKKYTIVLLVIGALFGLLGIIALFNQSLVLGGIAAGTGVLGPILVLFVGLAALGLGLYLIVLGIYFQVGHDFYLTNQRVVESVGFFSRRELSTEYRQINDLIVRQDFINKLILNTGTLAITTPGTSGEEFRLINIDNPVGRRDILRQLIRTDLNGQTIDRHTVAHAKVAVGMAKSEEEALLELDRSVGNLSANLATEAQEIVKEHEQTLHQPPSPAPTPTPSTPETEVEDLHGDGIDASDRLRAAQKRLDQ